MQLYLTCQHLHALRYDYGKNKISTKRVSNTVSSEVTFAKRLSTMYAPTYGSDKKKRSHPYFGRLHNTLVLRIQARHIPVFRNGHVKKPDNYATDSFNVCMCLNTTRQALYLSVCIIPITISVTSALAGSNMPQVIRHVFSSTIEMSESHAAMWSTTKSHSPVHATAKKHARLSATLPHPCSH